MSLIGETTAFVSIGSSCQTTAQLELNKELLEKLSGERLTKRSSFFDWLLTDTKGFARFLTDFKEKSLSESDFELPGWRYKIRDYNLWLWHDAPEELELTTIVSKYNYLLDNFRSFRKVDHRVFVFSNTQYNLVENTSHDRQFWLSSHIQDQAIRALDGFFPNGSNRFVWVANPDLTKEKASVDCHLMEVLEGAWEGSVADWAKVFSSITPAPSMA